MTAAAARVAVMSPKMQADERDRLIREMGDEQLECMTSHHALRRVRDVDDDLVPDSWFIGAHGYVIMRRCVGCDLVRLEVWYAATGERAFRPVYFYPDDWTHFVGLGRPPRDLLVKKLWRRDTRRSDGRHLEAVS